MLTTEEQLLRRLTRQLEEEALVCEASRRLQREAQADEARRRVQVARGLRDKSAARLRTLLASDEAWVRRLACRAGRIRDGEERWQPIWSSLVRASCRVGLVLGLVVTLFIRGASVALVPLIVLWVAALLPERP